MSILHFCLITILSAILSFEVSLCPLSNEAELCSVVYGIWMWVTPCECTNRETKKHHPHLPWLVKGSSLGFASSSVSFCRSLWFPSCWVCRPWLRWLNRIDASVTYMIHFTYTRLNFRLINLFNQTHAQNQHINYRWSGWWRRTFLIMYSMINKIKQEMNEWF